MDITAAAVTFPLSVKVSIIPPKMLMSVSYLRGSEEKRRRFTVCLVFIRVSL